MRTILNVDYHDDCLFGNGDLDSVRRMFERAKAAEINTILWSPMVCGKAHFPSKVATPIGNNSIYEGSAEPSRLLAKFDPLQAAMELAREYRIELLFYFRFFDDFFPGLEDDFLTSRPDLWWQSRCGNYDFQGWPSYHQAEVRDYKMRLFKELLAYKPDGFMLEVSRSHSWYVNPQRAANFFGFEAPVAEEYERRYGVNIRKFDHVEFLTNSDGIYRDTPFTYAVDYVNAAEFDLDSWHWLKGETVDSFVRELSAVARETLQRCRVLMQGGLNKPHSGTFSEQSVAKYYINASKLAADSVIDGYSYSENFKSLRLVPDIDSFFFPYFDGVQKSGKQVGGWFNDILTADGGHGAVVSEADDRAYVERAKATKLDYAVIHEHDFIARHPQSAAIWKALAEFK